MQHEVGPGRKEERKRTLDLLRFLKLLIICVHACNSIHLMIPNTQNRDRQEQKIKKTKNQRNKQIDKQTNKRASKQTNKKTKQKNKQLNKQLNKET